MMRLRFFSVPAVVFLLVSAAQAAPTFSDDVAPILYRHCVNCHRPGQAGPFSLLSYDDAKKRGQLLQVVTEARAMPPWHADPSDVPFENERRLSDAEIAAIGAWVAAGMPEGDPARLPAPPSFAEGWELGEPDLTLRMSKPFRVPADGPDIYQYFVLDIPLSEAKYVEAIEFQPGARSVVHHALGFFVSGDKVKGDGGRNLGALTGDRNRVLTWAVGTNPRVLPEGVGIRLEPGMKMILQTHFHPTGKAEDEVSRVGLRFARGPVERSPVEVQVPPSFGQISAIEAPAGSDRYTLRETFTLPVDIVGFAAFAHAHYLGKAFEFTAEKPDGEKLTLLRITDYDFAWQELYNFRAPIRLPAGTKLTAVIRWDNTARNRANPFNPPKNVRWGLYSEDEMGSLILDAIAADPADEAKLLAALDEHRRWSAVNFLVATDGKFFDGRAAPDRGSMREALKIVRERFGADGSGKLSEAGRRAARAELAARGFDDPTRRDDAAESVAGGGR